MIHSDHPAIAVAASRVAELGGGFGTDFTPTAIRVLDDAVALTMDSTKARFIIIMENVDGEWSAPSTLVGTSRPEGPRAAHTPGGLPLKQMSRKRIPTRRLPEQSWFAIAGLAAEDAIGLTIIVDGHEHREPIGEDGLAFAVARVRTDQEPIVVVHTREGRALKVTCS